LPSIEASAKYCCRRERAVGSAPINTSDKNNVVVNASARGPMNLAVSLFIDPMATDFSLYP